MTQQTSAPGGDAGRFLEACLDVLRGGDAHADDPAFGPTIEWLWDQANSNIGEMYVDQPAKLRALRRGRFAEEIVRQTGGAHPGGEDYLAMRDRLIATLEYALAKLGTEQRQTA